MVTFGKKILVLIIFILNTGMSCEENPAFIPQSPPPVLVAETGFDLEGISIEPGGKTVLATEGFSREIWRFTLGTGEKTVVFDDPYTSFRTSGVVVEPGGTTALVTRWNYDEGDLIRVNTATGAYNVIASGLRFGSIAIGLALEDGGETALVAEMDQLTRVNLTDGTKTPIATFDTRALFDVAIESPGETAIVFQNGKGFWRVNLKTGVKEFISTLVSFDNTRIEGLAYEPSKSRAIVGYLPSSPFCCPPLLQVDLITGQVTTIVKVGLTGDIVIEEGGKTALIVLGSGIYRVQLP